MNPTIGLIRVIVNQLHSEQGHFVRSTRRHNAQVAACHLFSQVEQRSAHTIPEGATPPAAPTSDQ